MSRENLHSRVVAGLKIALPLAALAILSTVFLLSRSIDPATTIPFAEVDLTQRAEEEGMTSPSFSGATQRGDLVVFSAAIVRPDPAVDNRFLAVDVTSQIDLAGGGRINLTSASAHMDGRAEQVTLGGGVILTSSTGYEISTDQLQADLKTPTIESADQVTGTGPAGSFTAGKMRLSAPDGKDHAQLLFTNGVRLVYRPAEAKE